MASASSQELRKMLKQAEEKERSDALRKKSILCKHFVSESCTFGSKCHFLYDESRTETQRAKLAILRDKEKMEHAKYLEKSNLSIFYLPRKAFNR